MVKKLLPKYTLLLLAFIAWTECICQNWGDTISRNPINVIKSLPFIPQKATVKGFVFEKYLYINKESLNKGFKVVMDDASFKIVYFVLSYDCEGCDIWQKAVYNDTITVKDVPILPGLKKNELLHLSAFKVEKNGKYFTIPEVAIFITE